MPTYDYKCGACGVVSEVQHKMSESGPASCPRCAGGPMTKLISPSSFILKGGGWYATDYKPRPKTEASDSAPKASSESDGKAAPKAEPKAEGGAHQCASGCKHG